MREKVLKAQYIGLESMTDIHEASLISLIKGCLKWDPETRLSASEIMDHSWFKYDSPRKGDFTRLNYFLLVIEHIKIYLSYVYFIKRNSTKKFSSFLFDLFFHEK
jgi:serine/threonine protein kinase